MSKLKINITANFLGNILVAVFSLLFVPFYIKYLGIEAYGLIGFSISLRALTLVLDFGMGTSVSRELAQLTVRENKNAKNIRNTLKTFEWVYLINAVLIAVVLTALAPWLSTHWIQARGLSVETLFHSLVLMGWSIAVLWPFNLYSFALQGLQKQVLQNFIGVFFALAKGLATLFVLKNISASIELFFLCQLVIYALQTLCTYVVVWMTIPASKTKAAFKKSIFENSFKFFIKVGLISLLASLILQLDKITLSKLLPLEQFGYYSLAWALAGGLYYFIYPIGMAIFPHMTQLAFKKNETALKNTYHSSSQLLSVILFPIVLLLYFFSPQVLRLWINQAQTVAQVAPLLSLIVVAVALNGLTQPSYFLQFAYGKTKLLF
jgi:O-antigen/teichoic acid export membrane protein